MGVHGLWKLIESSGKPIPIETLENKVLAVDVSIWLHQAIKGFQDHKGAPVPNAHLLGIYHRVCKLLYFKIKPVFVFDGGVPALKRQTIAKRHQVKARNSSEADRLQKQLLSTLLKHSAISKVLSEKTKASLPLPKKSSGKYDNLYALPSADFDSTLSSSEDDDTEEITESATPDSSPTKQWDLHTIDTTSTYFKSMPLDVKHEILTELKETRKQNSWGRLHQLPKQSDDFSVYQMKRLLKRQEVQSALEEVSKEMGGMSLSLAELESLLKDQGIQTTNDSTIGKRIASDENTRYLYIKDIHQELKKAEEKEQIKNGVEKLDDKEELEKAIKMSLEETPANSVETESKKKTISDLEEEEELQKAIQLSLEETPSTSVASKMPKLSSLESFNIEDFQLDSEEDDEDETITKKNNESYSKNLSSAQSYMLEYSGLTPSEIDKIINKNTTKILQQKYENTQKIKAIKSLDSIPRNNVNILTKTKLKSIPEVDISDGRESYDFVKSLVAVDLDKKLQKNKDTILLNEEYKQSDAALDIQDIKDNSEVDIMSDSSESSNEDIDMPKPEQKLEIIIDPDKKDDDDDLFSDIFNEDFKINTNKIAKNSDPFKDNTIKTKELNITKSFEIIIDPNKTGDDDGIFNDIFGKDKPATKNKFDILEKKNQKITSPDKVLTEEVIKSKESENDEIKITHVNKKVEEKKMDEIAKNTIEPVISKLSMQEMEELRDDLQSERIDLIKEIANKERLANNITDQMYQEAQELLELFGVPYVVAPMEAEAQCAFLDEIELTDGTITDDSDIWLFGGRTVYKNFFNQSKYVMEFKSENIEHHFKLNRQQMILLALLVGSDYTTGLQGVGPVTALEILASFPPSQSKEFKLSHHQLISGLKEFKSWFVKGQAAGPGRLALKNKLKNISFMDSFPSSEVVGAYLDPKVETSKDAFSWGKPDITSLTVFAKDKFGWTMKKTEEILNPVIKKLEENQLQKSIKDYFKTKFIVKPVDLKNKVSKRVKTAIDRFGKTPEELIAEEMAELEKDKEKAIRNTKAGRSEKSKLTRTKKNKAGDTNNAENSLEKTENLNETNLDKKIIDGTSERAIAKRSQTKLTKKIEEQIVKEDENNETQLSDSNLEEEINNMTDRNKNVNLKKSRKKSAKSKMGEKSLKKDAIDETQPPKRQRKKKEASMEIGSETFKALEEIEDLKDYANLASELKTRRKRRNELLKIKIDHPVKKKPKIQQQLPVEEVPKELIDDYEINLLRATTSQSNKRVEEIKNEVIKSFEKTPVKKKPSIPTIHLHTKDIIHQKLKDKSDLLQNKLKAIEVYRKSTKGPGYVPKKTKKVMVPKEDAGLSEDSD